MYIWIGIDVDEQLCELRKAVCGFEKQVKIDNSNLTLPFHISLKISFCVDDSISKAVMDDIESILRKTKSFEVEPKEIEYCGSITWLRYKENAFMNACHDELNSFLLEKYGVPLHEYDLDYKFHTTLAMDNNSENVRIGYEMLKNCYHPDKIRANKFVIGYSHSGELGSYSVCREIIAE